MKITIENYQLIETVSPSDYLELSLLDDHWNISNYTMWVNSSYLSDNYNNDVIFQFLGVDKVEFCDKAYGYRSTPGGCPECKKGDYAALTRLVKAIFDEYICITTPSRILDLVNIDLL